MTAKPSINERASRIRLILMDIDGVLTDGRIHIGADGSETKSFNVRDGAGLKLAQKAGILTGVISGRDVPSARHRAEELALEEVHLGIANKEDVYAGILERRALTDGEVCYVGDDIIDIPVMRRAGLSVAPADAHPAVMQHASLVTVRRGGMGAVREVIDLILHAQDKWRLVTARYIP